MKALKAYLQFQLRIDKKVKKYLGIETLVYKFWWLGHVRAIQRELDAQR